MKNKTKVLKIVFILVNLILPLLFFLTDGKENLILLYPIIIVFNCYYIYQLTLIKKNIVLITSLLLSYPLVWVLPFLYILMLVLYLVMFFIKKNNIAITIFLFLLVITVTDTIRSDYYKISKDYFILAKEKTHLGFSPSKEYYAYCMDATLYMERKREIFDVLGQFSGRTTIEMSIDKCDQEIIKWISDYEIEVNGKMLLIKDESKKFINGQIVN